MSEATERGITDHRALHSLERTRKDIRGKLRDETETEYTIQAAIARWTERWCRRRGYTVRIPAMDRDATQQPGADSPATDRPEPDQI